MNVLVLGGTGTVGSQVFHELLKRECEVTVLTRSGDRAKNLPKNAHAVIGDLLDPETVRSIFKKIDTVFLLNAVSPTETHEGLMAVNGARLAGVKRIVYLSVPKLEQAPHLPHFGSKLPVETAIKASRIPYTILKPNNFFQNDCIIQESANCQVCGRCGPWWCFCPSFSCVACPASCLNSSPTLWPFHWPAPWRWR